MLKVSTSKIFIAIFIFCTSILFISCAADNIDSKSNSQSSISDSNFDSTNEEDDKDDAPLIPKDKEEAEYIPNLNYEEGIYGDLSSTNTDISSNSGNLYTVIYYTPNNITGSNISVSISGSIAPSASGLYAPSFFQAYSSKYEEKIEIDADILARTSAHLELQRESAELMKQAVVPNYAAPNFSVNFATYPTPEQKRTFRAFRNGSGTQTNVASTLAYTSEHAIFYIEDSIQSSVDQKALKEVIDAFEKDYYKFTIGLGAEPGDTDGNGKVIFLIMNITKQDLMGFFHSSDQMPKETCFGQSTIYTDGAGNIVRVECKDNSIKSNGADILYINVKYLTSSFLANKKDKDHLVGTLFHELQHMIMYNQHFTKKEGDTNAKNQHALSFPSWINEGVSMLSEYVAGHALSHVDYVRNFFLANMRKTIVNNSLIEYGYDLLFLQYLYERFGGTIIKKIYDTEATTEDEIFKAVTGKSFKELYADFAKMLIMTGRNVTQNPRYEIDAFNYIENSSNYNKTGFNLKNEIDLAISYHSGQSNLITNIAKDSKYLIKTNNASFSLPPYSFTISRWSSNMSILKLNNQNVSGAYVIAR